MMADSAAIVLVEMVHKYLKLYSTMVQPRLVWIEESPWVIFLCTLWLIKKRVRSMATVVLCNMAPRLVVAPGRDVLV